VPAEREMLSLQPNLITDAIGNVFRWVFFQRTENGRALVVGELLQHMKRTCNNPDISAGTNIPFSM